MTSYLSTAVIFYFLNFYAIQFTDVAGNNRSMSEFQNKRVLLVNIATNSNKAVQIGELQQLQQNWGDSLVVIAFPSNSFGNEPRSNEDIRQYCQATYGATFLIASKGNVNGAGLQSLYAWLTNGSQNGVMNTIVSHDFQKYLIDRQGKLVAVFNGSVSPLSSAIQVAISEN